MRIAPAKNPHVGFCRCLPAGFGQHLEGGLIDIDHPALQYRITDEIDQGETGCCRLHGPVAQGGPADIHPQPGEHLLLPVERHMIDKLAGEHMGQQPGRGNGFWDDPRRHRCNAHRLCIFNPFALPAGVLGPDLTNDLDLGGDDIELLTHLLADTG